MRSRKEREWGRSAWTDPIPTQPRITGNFKMWPWRHWSLLDILVGRRLVTPEDSMDLAPLMSVSGGTTVLIRPDRSGNWAEVKTV